MIKAGLVALLSICLVSAGCTTSRTVYLSDAGALATLEKGDLIDVTLKSGEVRKLKLTAIDANSVSGTDARSRRTTVQLALAEVQSLDVRKLSFGKTVSFGSGVLFGAGALFLALLTAAHADDE
jgi:hypothetical protein